MPKSLVNLSSLVVVTEIEQIVESHYLHYDQILTHPDLRQELIEYVLARVRSLQINLQMGGESQSHIETVPCLTEIKLQIENFVHQGICHLLQRYERLVNQCFPQKNAGYLRASDWFG